MEKTSNWWTYIKDPTHSVVVKWENQHDFYWNQICSDIVEVFGLPGNRFYYKPEIDYMTFIFKTKKDADMCRILISEKI